MTTDEEFDIRMRYQILQLANAYCRAGDTTNDIIMRARTYEHFVMTPAIPK